MYTYLISYDLDKPGQNYAKLSARLQQLGAFRIEMSLWAAQAAYTAVQLRDDLRGYIDANDRLLVAQVGTWASWNLMDGEKFKQIAA